MPKIDQGVIERLPFPVPPKPIQAAIVADAERWATMLDVRQGELTLAEKRLKSLRLSILAAAFSGELVPQDPDDEPAAVLLKRISAQRESANDRKPVDAQGGRRRRVAV
jgi:type I restriction enzyme S subunit